MSSLALAPPTDPAAVAAADRAERAAVVQDRWHRGEPADALAALAADPDLAADRPLALELAYEEFCLRRDAGERVDPDRFAARFPFAASLLRLVAVHSLLDRHPELLPHTRPEVQFRPGDDLGDYRVLRPLGRGGFADVYLARDMSTGGRAVVIKVSSRNDGEADTLGRLAHPHLMPVWSAPRVGPGRVLVMPFLGVATVEHLLPATDAERATYPPATRVRERAATARRPDDPPYTPTAPPVTPPGRSYEADALAVARGVADALAHLHANGVAHRDVKPSNILLGPTGHPYLLDLNLAEASSGAARLGGTVPYLAPEVLAAPLDGPPPPIDWAAADVYSLGVVVWELLAGRHPYLDGSEFGSPDDPWQAVRRVADRQRRTPYRTARRPRVSRAVWAAVGRCLSANPAERPTAADLARLFAPRPPRRGYLLAAALAGVMAVGAGGGTWAALPAGRATAAVEEPKGAFERGVEFHKSGHHDFAAIAFMKAGEENRDGRAYACAAYCHALSSLTTNTLACANRAEELGYTGVDLNVVRAYCHMRATDYQEALAECDRALRRVPNCRAALLIKSVVQIRQHERDGGRPPLDRQVLTDLYAVTTTPGPITGAVWLFAAKAHLFQSDRSPDDVTRAINAVREAVRLRAKHTVLGTRSIHDTLAPDPRYQDALATAPLSNPPTRVNPYLICPIPD